MRLNGEELKVGDGLYVKGGINKFEIEYLHKQGALLKASPDHIFFVSYEKIEQNYSKPPEPQYPDEVWVREKDANHYITHDIDPGCGTAQRYVKAPEPVEQGDVRKLGSDIVLTKTENGASINDHWFDHDGCNYIAMFLLADVK